MISVWIANVELALANLDLNEPMLGPITFVDGNPLEGSSSTPVNAKLRLDTVAKEEEEEDGRDSSGDDDFHDVGMEEDY